MSSFSEWKSHEVIFGHSKSSGLFVKMFRHKKILTGVLRLVSKHFDINRTFFTASLMKHILPAELFFRFLNFGVLEKNYLNRVRSNPGLIAVRLAQRAQL